MFPGDWTQSVKSITVNHRIVVVKTIYGAHPRLAKSFTEGAWSTLEASIRSRDCCAIGECGLDYTEPAHSLPGQRQLFQQQVTLAHQLRKQPVLHLCESNRLSMSDVMRKAAAIPGDNTPPTSGFTSTATLAVSWTTSTGLGNSPIACRIGFTHNGKQGLVRWHVIFTCSV